MSSDVQADTGRRAVPTVVAQHAEESQVLWNIRLTLCRAPHVELDRLRRFDSRLSAHLDGLGLGKAEGMQLVDASLENPTSGSVFVANVRAIEDRDTARLDKLFAVAGTLPEVRRGFLSAFGWVSAPLLQSIGKALLAAQDPMRRFVGIAACEMHGVDPGAALVTALNDEHPNLRARALRTAGVLGKLDLVGAVMNAINDSTPSGRSWSAWSAVLLGNRGAALGVLLSQSKQPGALRERAMRLALRAVDLKVGHALLRELAGDPKEVRALIQGAGILGDPQYVPWLIKQMEDVKVCRLAGESFSLITGLDLSYLDLDRKPPENAELVPNDNPNDADVEMDPDDGLPWPDPARISSWWAANGSRFSNGVRYFMGAPPTREHCIEVLKTGFQLQRIAAAVYLCILNPGTPLFNTAAPAWRQQRLLAVM